MCSQQMAVDDIENLNYDSLEAVAHLQASDRYKDIMQVSLSRFQSTPLFAHQVATWCRQRNW